VGIGCPGTVNIKTGVVEFSNNLKWKNIELRKDIKELTGFDAVIDNDANAAAYGEYVAGVAKGVHSAIILTLGTGIGGGIIINDQVMRGFNYAGGEIGHMVIETDGKLCTCGRRGCFEAYASATGLNALTAEAVKEHPKSILAALVEQDGRFSARQPFVALRKGDATATEVLETFTKYLATGIINLINIFQPEIIGIGGGLSNEGDYLLEPLRKRVNREVYGAAASKGDDAARTKIIACKLGNEAGIIGAAALPR